MKIKKILKKKRRGVFPLILLLFIPIALFVAWALAKIFLGAVKEKV